MLNLFLEFLNKEIMGLESCERSRRLIFDHWNLNDKERN